MNYFHRSMHASITCVQVYKGVLYSAREWNTHGLPDTIYTAHLTRGHLTGQLGQVTRNFLRCKNGKGRQTCLLWYKIWLKSTRLHIIHSFPYKLLTQITS